MRLNKSAKFLAAVIFATLIEIIFFDLSSILNVISNYRQPVQNKVLSIEEAQLINWDTIGGTYVSQADPMIVFEGINARINNFRIKVVMNQDIDGVTVFYTKNNSGVAGELKEITSIKLKNNEANVKLDDDVYSIRVDLGENAGTKINNFSITLNPLNLNFSISRVVAMLIIYFFTRALFRLHKSPEYGIE